MFQGRYHFQHRYRLQEEYLSYNCPSPLVFNTSLGTFNVNEWKIMFDPSIKEIYRYRKTLMDTRSHSFKLYKKRSRLLIRANTFSNRVIGNWNSLTEDIVYAPYLNAFKSRLYQFW